MWQEAIELITQLVNARGSNISISSGGCEYKIIRLGDSNIGLPFNLSRGIKSKNDPLKQNINSKEIQTFTTLYDNPDKLISEKIGINHALLIIEKALSLRECKVQFNQH